MFGKSIVIIEDVRITTCSKVMCGKIQLGTGDRVQLIKKDKRSGRSSSVEVCPVKRSSLRLDGGHH